MSVNGVIDSYKSYNTPYEYNKHHSEKSGKKDDDSKVKDDAAAVYESQSKNSKKVTLSEENMAKVKKMKMELSNKSQQMQSLVNSLFGTQGKKAANVTDLIKGLRNGTLSVDAATIAQAKEEIGEDGYWGVEQTSNRLLDMAKALSNGDPSKADELIAAMEKGFKQAERAAGGELPPISQQTIDAARDKINAWKNGEE